MTQSRPGRTKTVRHSRAVRLLLLLSIPLAFLFVSCDGERNADPLAPDVDAAAAAVPLECTANVALGTLACKAPAPRLPSGVQAALILGGQGINVLLASENVCFESACDPAVPAGIFQAEVSVTNLIGQAIGTNDGENVDAAGVRIFFHKRPAVTATTDGQSATAEVHNETGTGTFSAADQPYFQYDELLAPNATSGKKVWQWRLSPNVETFTFGVMVSAEVQHPNGWVDISPAMDTLAVGDPEGTTSQLTAVVRDMLGAELPEEPVTWSSSDPAKLTVDGTGLVNAVSGTGWVTITATAEERTGTAEILLVPYIPPIAAVDDVFPHTVLGNVSVSSGASGFSATANDAYSEAATVTFVGWNGAAGKSEHGGDVTMTASGDGMGEFTYDPPAGFEGTDAFHYVLSDGVTTDTATVSVTVGGMVWFVNNAAPSCTSVAAGCGRLSSPFSSSNAFKAANNGSGNNPDHGDVIFFYESGTDYDGPIKLRTRQKLIGQDATESLESIMGAVAPPGSAALPVMNPGNGTRVRIVGNTGGIALGMDNSLRGLTVSTSGGIGIEGEMLGTLTLAGDVDVVSTNGPALKLANGTLSGAFRSVSANGGVNGIVLSNTTGTFQVAGTGTAGSGGSIQNTTGDGVSLTNTGPVSLAWMSIQNSGGNGIRGNTVGGFSLRRSTMQDNGDAENEHGLSLTGLTGTARIDTVRVYGSFHDEVYVANSTGTLNLEMHGNDFSNPVMPANTSLNDGGVRIEATGTATVNVVADDNTIGNQDGYNFRYATGGAAGGGVKLTNNRMGATYDGSVQILGGAAVPGGMWSGNLTYDVANNTINGAGNVSVIVGATNSAVNGSARGVVRGNTFGQPGVAGSCGYWGLYVNGDGNGSHVASVTNNVLHQCRDVAIQPLARFGTGRLDVIVQGNVVTTVQGGAGGDFPETFQPKIGDGGAGHNNTMCLVAGHPSNPALKNSLDHRVTDIGTEDIVVVMAGTKATLILEGYVGPSDPIAAGTFLGNSNTYRGGAPASVYFDVTASNYTITGGTCARP